MSNARAFVRPRRRTGKKSGLSVCIIQTLSNELPVARNIFSQVDVEFFSADGQIQTFCAQHKLPYWKPWRSIKVKTILQPMFVLLRHRWYQHLGQDLGAQMWAMPWGARRSLKLREQNKVHNLVEHKAAPFAKIYTRPALFALKLQSCKNIYNIIF